MKTTFIRYISHEIRTPMNVIKSGLQVLRREFAASASALNPDVYLSIIDDVERSCEVALEVLNDMLLFDKIESGLLVLEMVDIDIWPFLKKTGSIFEIQVCV